MTEQWLRDRILPRNANWADTGDARVTITQGYSFYHALKDNGVPVKFVAFPIPGHSPGDPVRRMEMYRRWVEWMDQYLK